MKITRFAYREIRGEPLRGLLEAVDMDNARDHLGNDFQIAKIQVEHKYNWELQMDADRRSDFVNGVFCHKESEESNV